MHPPATMVVRFHVIAPATKQRTLSVRLPILLGRGEEAKLRIQHDLVSRRHCEFFERQGQVYVRDLGSTNGTFLNNEQVPVSTKIAVPPGGIVRVGGLSFTVEYELPAAVDSPGAAEDQGQQDSFLAGESRVDTRPVTDDSLEEQPDFKIEHTDQQNEATAPGMVSTDDVAPTAEEPLFRVADETAGLPAETSGEATAAALPQAQQLQGEEPAAGSDQQEGFAFLSGGQAADPPAEAAEWPAAETNADVPDDDQLDAFFKGLK